MNALASFSESLLVRLAAVSLEAVLVVALVALVVRLLPRLSAAVRCGLWWLVAAKLLLSLAGAGLGWGPTLPPSWGAGEPPSPGRLAALAAPLREVDAALALPVLAVPMSREQAAAWPAVDWPLLIAGLWLALLVVGLGGIVRELAALSKLRRAVLPVPELAPTVEAVAGLLGLERAPVVAATPAVVSPLLVGPHAPLILLPEPRWRSLDRADLASTLAHEMAHHRRRDLWWGWVPVAARLLFWFHPLVRYAVREYQLAREAACDAEALAALGTAPRDYGRVLLAWSAAPRGTGLAAASVAPAFVDLKRRILMLGEAQRGSHRRLGRIVLAAGLLLLPLRFALDVAATPAEEARAPHAPMPVASPQPAPAAAPAPAPTPPSMDRRGTPPPAPPAPIAPPSPPDPPAPPAEGGRWSWDSSDIEVPWVLLKREHSVMSGSTRDWQRAKSLRRDESEPLLWFRLAGREYVTKDPATLATLDKLWEESNRLAEKQAALGEQQGELGAQQGELGARQGELGAAQGALGASMAGIAGEMSALAAELATLEDPAELEERSEELDAETERKLESLSEQMEALGREQEKLGEQQEALGKQQEALGRQQEALGRQQEAASEKARLATEALLKKLVAEGKAAPAS